MDAKQTLYLNENWLDEVTPNVQNNASLSNAGAMSSGDLSMGGNSNGWYYGDIYYPWYTPTYPWHTTVTVDRKIRLKLSEIEHLRKCAAKDAKLKATLKKFAPLVEVEVDF